MLLRIVVGPRLLVGPVVAVGIGCGRTVRGIVRSGCRLPVFRSQGMGTSCEWLLA